MNQGKLEVVLYIILCLHLLIDNWYITLCCTAYPCCLKFKMNNLKYNEILSSNENHCKLKRTEIAECFLSLQGCSKLEINLLKKGIGKSPTTLRFSNIPIGKKMSMHQEENTMEIKFSKYYHKQ